MGSLVARTMVMTAVSGLCAGLLALDRDVRVRLATLLDSLSHRCQASTFIFI